MKKVTQTFSKGVNRRIARDQSTPERLHTLQNARLFKRGETLYVGRIDGYRSWPDEEIESLAVFAGPASFDTTTFQRGYRIEFVDEIGIDEDQPIYPIDRFAQPLDSVRFGEEFNQFKNKNPLFQFTEGVSVGDRLPRTPRVAPILRFTDGVAVDNNDVFTYNSFLRLSFVDGVTLKDTPLCDQ
jgi:hypothetical protein